MRYRYTTVAHVLCLQLMVGVPAHCVSSWLAMPSFLPKAHDHNQREARHYSSRQLPGHRPHNEAPQSNWLLVHMRCLCVSMCANILLTSLRENHGHFSMVFCVTLQYRLLRNYRDPTFVGPRIGGAII